MFAKINNLSGSRVIVYGIKYIPLLCTLLTTIHIGLLVAGKYEPITVGAAAALMLLLLVLLSIRFKFCKLHKAMILYGVGLTACVCIQKLSGFGPFVTAFRVVMMAVGIGLLALALYKWRNDECGE